MESLLTLINSSDEAQVSRAALLRLPKICILVGVGIDNSAVSQNDFPVLYHVTRKSMRVAVKCVL